MPKPIEAGTSKRRRSIRLDRRDYSFPGTYFVTICSFERRSVFGRVQDAEFMPSELGLLVRECWVAIPLHFPHVELHEVVVMPNHLHGLLAIVRSFKAIVAKRAHKELGWNGPIWQRNYFERVLRDGKEFSDASRYIAENPKKWEWDRENPQCETR